MVRHLAPLALLLSAAGVGAAPVGSADPLAEVDDEDSRPQASRSGRRLTESGGGFDYTFDGNGTFSNLGTADLNFAAAYIDTTNLGGWCGWYCPSVTDNGYSTITGTCADAATPYTPSGQYVYDNELYTPDTTDGSPECEQTDPAYMVLGAVGTTPGGVQIDLRVENKSLYVPWNAMQNGLNGDWMEINVLGNEPVRIEGCFVDHDTSEEVLVDFFNLTLVDLDDTITGYNEEIQILESEIDGYELFTTSDGSASEVQVTVTDVEYTDPDTGATGTSSALRFRSSERGIGKDNPQNLDALTTDNPAKGEAIQIVQQARSFKLIYSSKSCFQIKIAVVWPGYHDKVDFATAGLNSEVCSGGYSGNNCNTPSGEYPAGTGRNIQIAIEGQFIVSPSPPNPPSPPPPSSPPLRPPKSPPSAPAPFPPPPSPPPPVA
jgi:hypothetical protein